MKCERNAARERESRKLKKESNTMKSEKQAKAFLEKQAFFRICDSRRSQPTVKRRRRGYLYVLAPTMHVSVSYVSIQ